MKIQIDQDKCFKSGECCYNHPKLFKLGEDGYPVILLDKIEGPENTLEAHQAIEVCPAVAIALVAD